MQKEIVTGATLVGEVSTLQKNLEALIQEDYDFFVDANVKPFSSRIMSDSNSVSVETTKKFSSFDGKVTDWGKNYASALYVENGLVLPAGMEKFSVDVKVKGAFLEDDKATVTLEPQGKVPGVFRVTSEAMYSDGVDATTEYVVFLDAKKVARAMGGVAIEPVEKGLLDDKGKLTITESKTRSEIIARTKPVEKEVKKEKPKEVVKEKTSAEIVKEMGYPETIFDMGTGLSKVYEKTMQADWTGIRHLDLFPNDLNAACPILKDARVNLENTELMAVTIPRIENGQRNITIDFIPASLELKLSNFENDHTAFGPALAKNIIPGHAKDGSVFFMDVSDMSVKQVQALTEKIEEIKENYNKTVGRSTVLSKDDLANKILLTSLEMGAKPPVLSLGVEFEKVAKEYEANRVLAEEKAKELQAEQKQQEVVKVKKTREQILQEREEAKRNPEPRDKIFVRDGILEVPDKDDVRKEYKLRFKVKADEYVIYIPKATEEMGRDHKPMTYVKSGMIDDELGYNKCYWIMAAYKLGEQFRITRNGFDLPKDANEAMKPLGAYEPKKISASYLKAYINVRNKDMENELENRKQKEFLNKGMGTVLSTKDSYEEQMNELRAKKAVEAKEKRTVGYSNYDQMSRNSKSLKPRFNKKGKNKHRNSNDRNDGRN